MPAILTRRRLAWTAALSIPFGAWWMAGRWGGPGPTLWVVDLIAVLAPLLAAWAFSKRAHAEVGRMAVAWELLALGAGAWTFGEALWAVDEMLLQRGVPVDERSVPFPSLSDAGYVLFLLLATAGLAALPSHLWSRSARLRVVLDGLLVGLGLFVVAWALLLQSQVGALPSEADVGHALAVVYPIGDVAMLALAFLAGAYAAPHEKAHRRWLLAGIGVLTVGDFAFWVQDFRGTYQSGGWLDLVWPAGFFLMGIAALTPGPQASEVRQAGDDGQATAASFLPALPASLGAAVLVGGFLGPLSLDAVVFAGLAGMLVLLAARAMAWRKERRQWAPAAPTDDAGGLAPEASSSGEMR